MNTRWRVGVAARGIGISNGPAHAQDGGAVSLDRKIGRFAPTELAPDLKGLSAGDRQALEKLIAAARLMDEIFLRQVGSGHVAMREKLAADSSPSGESIFHYFRIHVSPGSRIDDSEPWLAGVGTRPPGANHYPADITKEEFEAWSTSLPDEEKAKALIDERAVMRPALKASLDRLGMIPVGIEPLDTHAK